MEIQLLTVALTTGGRRCELVIVHKAGKLIKHTIWFLTPTFTSLSYVKADPGSGG